MANSLTVAVLGVELIWQNRDFAKSSLMLRWTAYVVAAVTVLIFGATDESRFIYFQF